MLKEYIREELVFLDLDSKDRSDLFQQLSAVLLKKGFVQESFHDFLSSREDEYPTGLELDGYNVAIPHGNPEFVKKPFIAVVRTAEDIQMYKMDNPDEAIPVHLFFVLGLNSGENHLTVLKTLLGHIQDEEFVSRILQAESASDVVQYIHQL